MLSARATVRVCLALGALLAVALPLGAVLVHAAEQKDGAPLPPPEPGSAGERPAPADAADTGGVVTPSVKTLAGVKRGNTRTFEVTAGPVQQQIANFPVRTVQVWGFSGSTPGPTLVMREGERLRVVLRNELIESTTLHFHGLHAPNDQDGVAGITQREPVPPGSSHTYELTPGHAGTFAYHSHTHAAAQTLRGLVGVIVVLPREERARPDVDTVMTLQQFAPTGPMAPVNPAPMAAHFPISTINGKTGEAAGEAITVRHGDRVRVRMYNASNASHSMHMHGHDIEVVSRAGHEVPPGARHGRTTENVAPGEFVEIEWTARSPGNWAFHCHVPHHTVNAHQAGWRGSPVGMTRFFHYEDAPEIPREYWNYSG